MSVPREGRLQPTRAFGDFHLKDAAVRRTSRDNFAATVLEGVAIALDITTASSGWISEDAASAVQ